MTGDQPIVRAVCIPALDYCDRVSNPAGLPRLQRRAARGVLLDPRGSVLLLHGRDPALIDGPTWWFTPGGGIHRGEDPVAALCRECWEELGFVPAQFAGPIAWRTDEFAFDGRWLMQESSFYWAAVPRFEAAPQQLTALERRFILGSRWWSMEDLRTTDETIYPTDLAALISAL